MNVGRSLGLILHVQVALRNDALAELCRDLSVELYRSGPSVVARVRHLQSVRLVVDKASLQPVVLMRSASKNAVCFQLSNALGVVVAPAVIYPGLVDAQNNMIMACVDKNGEAVPSLGHMGKPVLMRGCNSHEVFPLVMSLASLNKA